MNVKLHHVTTFYTSVQLSGEQAHTLYRQKHLTKPVNYRIQPLIPTEGQEGNVTDAKGRTTPQGSMCIQIQRHCRFGQKPLFIQCTFGAILCFYSIKYRSPAANQIARENFFVNAHVISTNHIHLRQGRASANQHIGGSDVKRFENVGGLFREEDGRVLSLNRTNKLRFQSCFRKYAGN